MNNQLRSSRAAGTQRLADRCPGNLLVALAATAAVMVLAVSRWLLADVTVPWDAKNQFYAFFRFLAESLHSGTSPFWNPYHYGGHPSIADPQSLVFWPPFLLWAAFDRAPSLRSFDLIVFAHLLIGGLGVVGLGWRRGWPATASVLAASVFMLGAAASARLNHTGIIVCFGIFPIAVLTLELALERRSLAWSVAFGVLAALLVIGRNQVSLMLCLVLLALAVASGLRASQPLLYVRQRLPMLATMAAVGTALSLVPLLLTLQLAQLSNRPSVSLEVALQASLHPASLVTLVAPDAFGSHRMNFEFWGPSHVTIPAVAATDDSFNYLFVGVVPMLLVLGLGIAGGRLWRPGLRTWVAILIAALLFSLGRYTPLFPWVFEHVPGFAFFRRPIDGVFVVGAALALIAGQLLADYIEHGLPRLQRWPLIALLGGLAAIGASTMSVAALTGHEVATLIEIGRMLPLAGLVVACLWFGRAASRRRYAATAVVLVAIAELVAWNAASRLNGEQIAYYGAFERASGEDQAALAILQADIAQRQRAGERPRVEIIGFGGPWQNLAMVKGIEATNGYNPLRIGLYDRYVLPGESPAWSSNRVFTRSFNSYDCAIARALGLEYVVLDRPIEQIRQVAPAKKALPLLLGPKIWIYRLPGPMPRVKFHTRAQMADADAVAGAGEDQVEPSPDQAVIDDETPLQHRHDVVPGQSTRGTARIVSWRPDRVEIEVEAEREGVVVLHDTFFPGWVARIDGETVPVLRADVLFRGVEVAAGHHRVVFSFEPLSWTNLTRTVWQLAVR